MISLMIFLTTISNQCPKVELQTNPPVNISEYIKHTWYVQQQQVNGYQKKEDLYCVTATYNKDRNSKVPFFNGQVISVYNYGNLNKTNGENLNNNTVLCARQVNKSEPEKLLVAPCFLPNLFAGPYWILAAGPKSNNYEWAVVLGGQPTVRVTNKTCTTKLNGVNNSGLWIFSRKQVMNETTLTYIKKIMYKKNISSDFLMNVEQKNCSYKGNYIK